VCILAGAKSLYHAVHDSKSFIPRLQIPVSNPQHQQLAFPTASLRGLKLQRAVQNAGVSFFFGASKAMLTARLL
jgi:hypothetical protein